MTRPDQTRPDQTRPDHYSAFYSDSFYEANQSDKNYLSSRKVIELLKKYLTPKSVIDIGCGVGQFLRAFSDSGVENICGVDGFWVKDNMLLIPKECFVGYDLSQAGLINHIPEKHFDLTVSSEVAEHIDPCDVEAFMDNLTSFSDVILFSAAIPGQGGDHHVNEQWPSYWAEKFAARGFIAIDCIRPFIWADSSIRTDYRQNLIMFVKENALDKYPALKHEAGRPVIDAVHNTLWEERHLSRYGFKKNCRNIFFGLLYLIPSFFRAVKKRL